jgi:hypothetical protein
MIWFLANWRLVAIAVLVIVPSAYGFVMKLQRDSARAVIAEMTIEARLQAERTKAEVSRQQQVTKEIDDAHKKRQNRLASDNARLRDELRQAASVSLVPAIPDATGGDDDPVACFDRGVLNAELTGVLQRLAARLGGIAGEGEAAGAAFAACSEWVKRELAH